MNAPTPVSPVIPPEDTVTILLIGGDNDYVLDMNTDTMIVVVVNKKTKQVSLLSIPRDLWVHIPGYDWSRINTAHRIGARYKYPGGGPGLLMRTIKERLGIPIDHWVRLSFQGFVRAVDEVGGVDVTLACPVNLRFRPPQSVDEEEMILEPGVHHLDGDAALLFVRTRRDGSDLERTRRQQEFLRAVWDRARRPDIITKIPGLWAALQGSFDTDLNLGNVLALAPAVLDLEPQRVRSCYIGRDQVRHWTTPAGWWVLVPISEKVQEVVASLYAPPAPDEDWLAQEAARIQVRNGTYRSELALIVADRLRWQGLQVVGTGSADRPDYPKTQIIVSGDKPRTLEFLTLLLGVEAENVIQRPDPGQPADIQVILGADYDPCR